MSNEETIIIEPEETEHEIEIESESLQMVLDNDYINIKNKPSINNVELVGNKSLEELGIYVYDDTEIRQEINNLDIEVDNLTENMNKISVDVNTNTNNINELEQNYNRLNEELIEQEQSINHLDDIKADKESVYTKEQVDNKVKGYATTSSLIAGINGCEPKMADTVDYVIETGFYGNGESGYRKYKNGLIEQWGVATTQASETEFTMHKPHINQNFSIFVEPREQGNFFHYAIPSGNQKFRCRIQTRDSANIAVKFQWRSWGRWK